MSAREWRAAWWTVLWEGKWAFTLLLIALGCWLVTEFWR
jgi:hypothetical protein